MALRPTTLKFMGVSPLIWPIDDIFSNIIAHHNREAQMRLTALATLVGAGLAVMTAPTTAAWHGYISHPLGFAFAAPGELKIEKGTYRGDVAGSYDTVGYRFVDDDIQYKGRSEERRVGKERRV